MRAARGGGPQGPTRGSPADDGPDADPVEVARTICLQQLDTGPRTRAQLATVLARRGVPDDAATAVLDRFTEVGLVDDAAFAHAWVESRHAGRGLSRRALRHELTRKGVGPAEQDAALELVDPASEEQAARALVRRRLPATRTLDAATRLRRLTGMLARKGYPAGLAFRVVRDELGTYAAQLPEDLVDAADPDETMPTDLLADGPGRA